MARPASTYRAARRNAWHELRPQPPWRGIQMVKLPNGIRRLGLMPDPAPAPRLVTRGL
jgi:hypothetical protein